MGFCEGLGPRGLYTSTVYLFFFFPLLMESFLFFWLSVGNAWFCLHLTLCVGVWGMLERLYLSLPGRITHIKMSSHSRRMIEVGRLECWPIFPPITYSMHLFGSISSQTPGPPFFSKESLYFSFSQENFLCVSLVGEALQVTTSMSLVPNLRFFLLHCDTTNSIVISSEVQGGLRDSSSSKADNV